MNSQIDMLRDRVKSFLHVNSRVDLIELKLHLECGSTELLLALGGLVSEQLIEIEKDGWSIIITKKH